MKASKRALFPKRPNHFATAFEGLPAIDFDRAGQMLKASDFSVPENWPANWPWLVAMHDALIKAHEHEQSAVRLRHSVSAFREMFLRRDAWPGADGASIQDMMAQALREARDLIHALRDGLNPQVGWDEYEASSPQMQQINAALARAQKET